MVEEYYESLKKYKGLLNQALVLMRNEIDPYYSSGPTGHSVGWAATDFVEELETVESVLEKVGAEVKARASSRAREEVLRGLLSHLPVRIVVDDDPTSFHIEFEDENLSDRYEKTALGKLFYKVALSPKSLPVGELAILPDVAELHNAFIGYTPLCGYVHQDVNSDSEGFTLRFLTSEGQRDTEIAVVGRVSVLAKSREWRKRYCFFSYNPAGPHLMGAFDSEESPESLSEMLADWVKAHTFVGEPKALDLTQGALAICPRI